MYSIKLDSNAIEQLLKPVNGDGGYQSLMRKLQAQYNHNNGILEYDGDDLEKLKRYANEYESGGFQGRFKAILNCIERNNL